MVVKQETASGLWQVLFFILLDVLATLLTRQLGRSTGLVTYDSTKKQTVQDYMVPVEL